MWLDTSRPSYLVSEETLPGSEPTEDLTLSAVMPANRLGLSSHLKDLSNEGIRTLDASPGNDIYCLVFQVFIDQPQLQFKELI